MKAEKLLQRRDEVAPGAVVELVLWRVPQPVPGSAHPYKYRLAYVVDGVCVVRFDNERGKGDHCHYGETEQAFEFTDVQTLLADFQDMIVRWNNENSRD